MASELPRETETLLVRLMAAGPLLTQAIAELSALPRDAHERVVAARTLLNLRSALEKKPNRSPEEQEFIVTIQDYWEQGREQGRVEARASDVLTVLRVRGIAVSATARKRILAQKDSERLERWLERAAVAASIAEVFREPS